MSEQTFRKLVLRLLVAILENAARGRLNPEERHLVAEVETACEVPLRTTNFTEPKGVES